MNSEEPFKTVKFLNYPYLPSDNNGLLNQDIPIKITAVNGCNMRYFDYENQATQPNDCKKTLVFLHVRIFD
jgi:hypothetical protein